MQINSIRSDTCNSVKLNEHDQEQVVYEIQGDNGSASMTRYQVFEGISLAYSDIHMETICYSHNMLPIKGLFAIHHCHEGRIECVFHNGECFYMGEGDIAVGWKSNSEYMHESNFPCSHYHGISIDIYIPMAQGEVDRVLGTGRIDLGTLCSRFCKDTEFGVIMQENDSMKHLFYELYHVPEDIKKDYFRLKVMEILLFLSAIKDIPSEHRPHFARMQVDKTKAIYKELIDDLARKVTIDEMAVKYAIAPTTLKECFKGIYGLSIYKFMKQYRMGEAAKLLLHTDKSILDIANDVGYENGSKFSAAFKKVIGVCPSEFRRKT